MPITLKTNGGKVDLTTPVIKEGTADLTNYYTKDETDAAIDVAIDAIPEPDLSGYALKTEIPSLDGYAKTDDIPDVSGFIIEIPEEYVTDEELNAKGYLTEHQSLEGYATETYVDEKMADIEAGNVPTATVDTLGIVKPDGVTIIIKDGVLTAVGGGGGGVWEYPTQFANDLRLFQGLTILQINNDLEVY